MLSVKQLQKLHLHNSVNWLIRRILDASGQRKTADYAIEKCAKNIKSEEEEQLNPLEYL